MEISGTVIEELAKIAPGQVFVDEPMARHTSFGLGGPVDLFLEPTEAAVFRDCAAYLVDQGTPLKILGRGTNLLVRSGGIDGAVMVSELAFPGMGVADTELVIGSGVPLSRVLGYCSEAGLGGLEGLAGIPGSMGGAVVTNAGSFGVSLGDLLVEIVIFEPGGGSVALAAGELQMEYRRIQLPGASIVERVRLALEPADPEEVKRKHKETLEMKWKTQPAGMRSAGCVFRNPQGESAGRLIDATGLKGLRVGGAVVSDLHAGYILNDRGGTSDDVEELIEAVRTRVKEETGVDLELEIEIVGRRTN
jgi:UDP-N-acetylmuramate dehydrogenase